MANISNLVRKLLSRNSKLFRFLRFISSFRAFKYLLRYCNQLLYPHWKKKKENEWKSFLKNYESIPETIDGRIRISINRKINSNTPNKKASLHHRHVWVNGPNYDSMEDNDIRGFVDGRYKNAWNQPGQKHTRVGRYPKSYSHRHGEWELFRTLQRWNNLGLPSDIKVLRARLELEVEYGVENNLEVLLYEVHKDWNPGKGGINRDNLSAPDHGEVWWNEIGHNIESWGLPGAGFASDSAPKADTPLSPLALASYHPGDSKIVFESDRLASYIEMRIHNDKPLLFLLKLSDYLEDLHSTCLHLYSGNHGDNLNTVKKPKLIIDWKSPNPFTECKRDILLEHGRSLILPRFEIDQIKNVAISFENKHTDEQPTIYIRGGNSTKNKAQWEPIYFPQDIKGWSWLEVRIDAHSNPIVIGKDFTAKLRETFVQTAPHEEQKVSWTFLSPSNDKVTILADYIGDFSWQITFKPDELGRWRYYWSHNLWEKPYKGPKVTFDVISENQENALKALDRLIEKIQSSELTAGEPRMYAYGAAFYRLQRELMRYEKPESFRLNSDTQNDGLPRELLDKARGGLGGLKKDV